MSEIREDLIGYELAARTRILGLEDTIKELEMNNMVLRLQLRNLERIMIRSLRREDPND